MASPVAATMPMHSMAARTSATDRPTSTADRHIGKALNRSIAPEVKSLLKPTPVPMADVVKLSNMRPAIAKFL